MPRLSRLQYRTPRHDLGLAVGDDEAINLTEPGAFWLHLVQNHFALVYVNTLWTEARRQPWPKRVAI